MLTVYPSAGRLIEIRGRETLDLPQFNAFRTEFTDALVARGGQSMLIVDLRGLQVLSAHVYEALLRLMKTDLPLIARAASLLEPGTLLSVNITRVIEAANNPRRTVHGTPEAAAAWLAPLLTPDEVLALRAFLTA